MKGRGKGVVEPGERRGRGGMVGEREREEGKRKFSLRGGGVGSGESEAV